MVSSDGQLRVDADLAHGRLGQLELVGGVNLGLDPERLHRRALQAQRLAAVAALRPDALHLQRARERVRVVLQGDDPLHRAGGRVQQHDAAL